LPRIELGGAFDLAPRVLLVGPALFQATNDDAVSPTIIERVQEEKGDERVQLHETVYLATRADLPIVGQEL